MKWTLINYEILLAEVSILDEAAMENAYNICHNVQDLLYFRGFFWEGSDKNKKGKKGKGKKKKK